MSDYDFRPGGALKLKGAAANGSTKRKKSSKNKAKDEPEERSKRLRIENSKEGSDSPTPEQSEQPADEQGQGSSSSAPGSSRKTAAERRFEEIQKQRRAEKIAKLASRTHKERVQEFNEKLESLSEHHDIPKVGPG